VFSSLTSLLRLASLIICLIVVASFALFVLNQTGSASIHQQEEINPGTAASTVAPGSPAPAPRKHSQESSARKTIDDASKTLTSPFSGVTAGSSSQWLVRGVNLLLALIVYGFGLGFLARVIRVRV
jgi:cytoskeletal protein RodZ